MLKGVMHPDDARRPADAGVTAVSVLNHGGNNLDGSPAPIRVLPAVGDRVEVVDGGVRRTYLWGLAVNGQAGVENVLDILQVGIDSTLLGLGAASIEGLEPDDVFTPPDFSPLNW